MTFDLKQEIADRLDATPDEVATLLDHVVRRIRQQVAHYGYARIAGLGTFRGGAEALTFEPDTMLEESVNIRFAGLTTVQVASPAAESREEERAGRADFEGVSAPPESAAAAFDGFEIPEADRKQYDMAGETEPPADFEDQYTSDAEEKEPFDETAHREPSAFEGDAGREDRAASEQPSPAGEDFDERAEDQTGEYRHFEEEYGTRPPSSDVSGESAVAGPPDHGGFEEEGERRAAEFGGVEDKGERRAEEFGGVEDKGERRAEEFGGVDEEGPERTTPFGDYEGGEADATYPDLGTERVEQTGGYGAFGEESDEHASFYDRPRDEGEEEPAESQRSEMDAEFGDVSPDEPGPSDRESAQDDRRPPSEFAGFEEPERRGEPREEIQPPDVREGADFEGYAVPEDADRAFWRESQADHPLGPRSEPPYEDAEFSVLGSEGVMDEGVESPGDTEEASFEQRGEEEKREPTVKWSPFGKSATAEGADSARDRVDASEQAEEADEEEPADSESAAAAAAGLAAMQQAPDRGAAHHEHMRPEHRHGVPPDAPGMGGRSVIWIGAGVIVLAAAAAVAYLTLFQPDPAGPATEDAAAVEEPATDTAAVGAAEDTTALLTDEGPVPPEESEPTATSAPLRSTEGIDPSAGGYTIVVFSETSRALAQEAAEEYREQGFRTDALAYEEGGTTRYRVGVGQFETLEEAVAERDRLADGALPRDAWILRIQ